MHQLLYDYFWLQQPLHPEQFPQQPPFFFDFIIERTARMTAPAMMAMTMISPIPGILFPPYTLVFSMRRDSVFA